MGGEVTGEWIGPIGLWHRTGTLAKVIVHDKCTVQKYPEDKFSLTAVTADGTPLGFLLQKIKKDDLTLANEVVAMIEKKKKV
jgi:hypothetical protein